MGCTVLAKCHDLQGKNVGKMSSHWGDGSRNSEPHSLSDFAKKTNNEIEFRLLSNKFSGVSFEVTAMQINTLTLFAACGTMPVGSKMWCAMENKVYIGFANWAEHHPSKSHGSKYKPIFCNIYLFAFVGFKHP